jgi:hypothetical protein
VKDENSAHILCFCEVLDSFWHRHLVSLFLEPEDVKMGPFETLVKPQGSRDLIWGTKDPLNKA